MHLNLTVNFLAYQNTYFQQAVNGKSRAQIGVLFQDMKTIVAVQTVSA